MAAPNIVNVTTITGVTSAFSGIALTTVNKGVDGITTVASNPSGSNKVLKINSLVASAIGSTTGVTVEYYDSAAHTGAANTVSVATTVSVPTYSTLVVISKENSIYLPEDTSLGVYGQLNAGTLDVICSFEEIS